MYFNEYDFLNQAIGIESASNIYFDKPPSQLNVSESASTFFIMWISINIYTLHENEKWSILQYPSYWKKK